MYRTRQNINHSFPDESTVNVAIGLVLPVSNERRFLGCASDRWTNGVLEYSTRITAWRALWGGYSIILSTRCIFLHRGLRRNVSSTRGPRTRSTPRIGRKVDDCGTRWCSRFVCMQVYEKTTLWYIKSRFCPTWSSLRHVLYLQWLLSHNPLEEKCCEWHFVSMIIVSGGVTVLTGMSPSVITMMTDPIRFNLAIEK